MRQFVCVLFVLLSNILFAGPDWFWQNPYPQGNQLNGVYTFDQDNMIAVGDLGTIVRTSDGGKTWQTQSNVNGVTTPLLSVTFVDMNNGWIVGERGVILKTTDGGVTWQNRSYGKSYHLYSVHFTSALNGWVAGRWGEVYQTSDGGDTWVRQESGTVRMLTSLNFANARKGCVVGHGGTILKTNNSGLQWDLVVPPTTSHLNSIAFVDSLNIWVSGENGTILKSADGGVSWDSLNTKVTENLVSIVFSSPQTGWAVGYSTQIVDGITNKINGIILKTDDYGATWLPQSSSSASTDFHPLNAVSLSATGVGYAVGDYGTIIKISDSGIEVQNASRQSLNLMRNACFVNSTTGWIAAYGAILRTVDGGENWLSTSMDHVTQAGGEYDQLEGIHFMDADTGWTVGTQIDVVGSSSYTTKGLVMKTTDGGETWVKQNPNTNQSLISVFFTSADTGWAVGVRGVVLKTTDGGKTWTLQNIKTQVQLFTVYFINPLKGWISGEGNKIWMTVDGGQKWTAITVAGSIYNIAVDFVDENHGWAVGVNGSIFKTEDGGLTWTAQHNNYTNHLLSVSFTDMKTGWAAGFGGTLLHTLDGGENWQKVELPTHRDLYSVVFSETSTGWVFGDVGIIFKTSNAISDVKKEWPETHLPTEMVLQQNYPNPFNGETTISYHISTPGKARLTVYNLLGEKIQTIVDRYHARGDYEIKLNANSFASGLYFYRLDTGDETTTRKMVIQK
jgi:photosystem II stability/assembly factor-like uncharacterized protein